MGFLNDNATIADSRPRVQLFGMTLNELQELCASMGFPKFTARQICDWLYVKQVTEIDAMTNLSLKVRAALKEVAEVRRMAPVECQVSRDGTKKYLFACYDAAQDVENHPPLGYVETVFIPEADRATLCVSCQMGCKMGCRFCATGAQGFHGHLSAGDILNQIFSIPESRQLTNIVYMGMGEPMDNYAAVMNSIQALTAPWGWAWSPHRITVSSVGVIPRLRQFLAECDCHLAISLHNAVASERAQIMPMQHSFPIADIVALLRQYDWSHQRRLTFEYTMMSGENDSERHAAQVVRLLSGLQCRVNLIRYHKTTSHSDNNHPSCSAAPSGLLTIQRFQTYLNQHGITCTLRASRGEDIMAACGLLAKVKAAPHQDS